MERKAQRLIYLPLSDKESSIFDLQKHPQTLDEMLYEIFMERPTVMESLENLKKYEEITHPVRLVEVNQGFITFGNILEQGP